MTDKELKRLSRLELVEIIYQLQVKQQTLTEENDRLQEALASKELKLSKAGSIAEASLGMFDLFNRAQEAVDLYLAEIHRSNAELEATHNAMVAKAQRELDGLRRQGEQEIAAARTEAAAILEQAQKEAKWLVDEAEKTAIDKIEGANAKIEQMLLAHSELATFLKR